MTAHELAKALLDGPDLPIATHASNHTYMSATDAMSHGRLKIGVLESYGGQHIIIGNFSATYSNKPNWYVSETLTSPQSSPTSGE